MGAVRKHCPLCELHRKLLTKENMQFWLEKTDDGAAVLVTDSVAQGGGINVLHVNYCPLCGRDLEEQEENQSEKENAELLLQQHGETDATGIPENG